MPSGGKTKTIRQTIFLEASPSEVYEAFLDAKKHAAFTGSRATCNPEIGGRFTAYDGYIWGKILQLEKGRRIVQTWQTTEWPPEAPPSNVEFLFDEKQKYMYAIFEKIVFTDKDNILV